MQLTELMEKVINNNIPKLLVLFGDERGIMSQYINKIVDTIGYSVVETEQLSSIVNQLTVKSAQAVIYIVKDDDELIKDENAHNILTVTNTYVILIYQTLNKTTKFYKRFVDSCVEFNRLDPSILANYTGLKAGAEIAKLAGCDYLKTIQYSDKVKLLMQLYSIGEEKALQSALINGVIQPETKNIFFEVINKLILGDITALELMKSFEYLNITLIQFMYSYYRSVRIIFLIKECKTDIQTLISDFELNPQQCNAVKGLAQKVDTGWLVDTMYLIRDVEVKFKSGKITEEHGIIYLALQSLL